MYKTVLYCMFFLLLYSINKGIPHNALARRSVDIDSAKVTCSSGSIFLWHPGEALTRWARSLPTPVVASPRGWRPCPQKGLCESPVQHLKKTTTPTEVQVTWMEDGTSQQVRVLKVRSHSFNNTLTKKKEREVTAWIAAAASEKLVGFLKVTCACEESLTIPPNVTSKTFFSVILPSAEKHDLQVPSSSQCHGTYAIDDFYYFNQQLQFTNHVHIRSPPAVSLELQLKAQPPFVGRELVTKRTDDPPSHPTQHTPLTDQPRLLVKFITEVHTDNLEASCYPGFCYLRAESQLLDSPSNASLRPNISHLPYVEPPNSFVSGLREYVIRDGCPTSSTWNFTVDRTGVKKLNSGYLNTMQMSFSLEGLHNTALMEWMVQKMTFNLTLTCSLDIYDNPQAQLEVFQRSCRSKTKSNVTTSKNPVSPLLSNFRNKSSSVGQLIEDDIAMATKLMSSEDTQVEKIRYLFHGRNPFLMPNTTDDHHFRDVGDPQSASENFTTTHRLASELQFIEEPHTSCYPDFVTINKMQYYILERHKDKNIIYCNQHNTYAKTLYDALSSVSHQETHFLDTKPLGRQKDFEHAMNLIQNAIRDSTSQASMASLARVEKKNSHHASLPTKLPAIAHPLSRGPHSLSIDSPTREARMSSLNSTPLRGVTARPVMVPTKHALVPAKPVLVPARSINPPTQSTRTSHILRSPGAVPKDNINPSSSVSFPHNTMRKGGPYARRRYSRYFLPRSLKDIEMTTSFTATSKKIGVDGVSHEPGNVTEHTNSSGELNQSSQQPKMASSVSENNFPFKLRNYFYVPKIPYDPTVLEDIYSKEYNNLIKNEEKNKTLKNNVNSTTTELEMTTPLTNDNEENLHNTTYSKTPEGRHIVKSYKAADVDVSIEPDNRGILGIGRYVSRSESSLYKVINEISYGPWFVKWGRNKQGKATHVMVASDSGFVDGAISGVQKEFSIGGGRGKLAGTVSYNEIKQEVAFSLARGNYGVKVDRSQSQNATAVEVFARGFQSGTILNFADRSIGQRIRIRNFEISIQHDFDDFFYPSDKGFGTEFLIQYRGANFALVNDVAERKLGISVGFRGHNVAVLHDFNQYVTEVQANWGRGWQLDFGWDFPDMYSETSYIEAGFGKLNRAFIQVGGGVGDDGVPQASVRLQTRNVGVDVDFLYEFGERVMQYAFTVGRFSYIWQANIDLTHVRVPMFLGIRPGDVERLLLSFLPRPVTRSEP